MLISAICERLFSFKAKRQRATVEHLIQNMENADGADYSGGKRPHGFDYDDMVAISKGMGNPKYIVKQVNGRYAEVVSFYSEKRGKTVIVAIDFAQNGELKSNYKEASYMHGYKDGFYNIVVTEYEAENLDHYLAKCDIIYDKQKMNRKYQVGSGRVVAIAHDNPFVKNDTSSSLARQEENAKNSKKS